MTPNDPTDIVDALMTGLQRNHPEVLESLDEANEALFIRLPCTISQYPDLIERAEVSLDISTMPMDSAGEENPNPEIQRIQTAIATARKFGRMVAIVVDSERRLVVFAYDSRHHREGLLN